MFAAGPAARLLFEATTESERVAWPIESLGHEVIVADPSCAPMHPERRRRVKTDRRHARMLAEAAPRQVRRQSLVRDLLMRGRGDASEA